MWRLALRSLLILALATNGLALPRAAQAAPDPGLSPASLAAPADRHARHSAEAPDAHASHRVVATTAHAAPMTAASATDPHVMHRRAPTDPHAMHPRAGSVPHAGHHARHHAPLAEAADVGSAACCADPGCDCGCVLAPAVAMRAMTATLSRLHEAPAPMRSARVRPSRHPPPLRPPSA